MENFRDRIPLHASVVKPNSSIDTTPGCRSHFCPVIVSFHRRIRARIDRTINEHLSFDYFSSTSHAVSREITTRFDLTFRSRVPRFHLRSHLKAPLRSRRSYSASLAYVFHVALCSDSTDYRDNRSKKTLFAT